MNKIENKLRSRAGASMILAMVFMLFTSFIGGSVLASATANAQRVAQIAEQQDFFLERSAVLLLSDQIQLDDGQYLRLSVTDSENFIEEVNVTPDGAVRPTGQTDTERIITFQVITSITPTSMHRLMLEATVWRYLREYDADLESEIVLVNFPESMESLTDFCFQYSMPGGESLEYDIQGSMNVTADVTPKTGGTAVDIPSYTANFSVGRDSHLYDFFVDFGEDTQVKLAVNGYSGTSNPITVPTVTQGQIEGDTNPTGDIRITTVSTSTTIAWEDPMIEKGAAA